MRKILCAFLALVWASATFAQTGPEIVNRMNEMLASHESDGNIFYIDIKMPIVGSISTKAMSLGDKARMEFEVSEIKVITYMDQTTQWMYNPGNNEVIITGATAKSNNPAVDSAMDMGMFDDIADGYDISIKSENLVKWELACKKKKKNPDKDAPKNITIEVRKETYQPLSFSTKIMGVTLTMRDFSFGVTEDQVTFNPVDYPGLKITDKRD